MVISGVTQLCFSFAIQIVNDTVGTLLAHAYRYPETAMGVIMGTGSNACKYEGRIDRI